VIRVRRLARASNTLFERSSKVAPLLDERTEDIRLTSHRDVSAGMCNIRSWAVSNLYQAPVIVSAVQDHASDEATCGSRTCYTFNFGVSNPRHPSNRILLLSHDEFTGIAQESGYSWQRCDWHLNCVLLGKRVWNIYDIGRSFRDHCPGSLWQSWRFPRCGLE
jgi:hypothetical protein